MNLEKKTALEHEKRAENEERSTEGENSKGHASVSYTPC